MKQSHQINQKAYKPAEGFIGHYQRLIKDVVIPYQYTVLCDEAEDTEKSHVIQNFINAGHALRGEDTGDGFYGWVFQDSDAAKWIEAAGYSLSIFPDKELEATVDAVIDLIAEAQDEDGYLDTYFTIKEREHRWQDLHEAHELYCAGHMMEAACAYYESTGKDKLLKVMQKNVAHIYHVFIEEGNAGYPGHPEVELALMKMYRLTKDPKCLELAKHFVDVRGVDADFYEKEAKKRDWTIWGNHYEDKEYGQFHEPVRKQKDAVGHAVRAVYLYTGMADVATETDDEALFEACRTLWNSITKKRMYVTGGIGSTVQGEAFTKDYDLPGDTAYAETCASIGLMFFASRMLEKETDRRYSDVMERALYNTVLAGMQLDGKRFFYVNPLEIVPGISGEAVTHKHDLTQRPKWYSCACCPPNVARTLSSIGKYAYGENEGTAFCHLFIDGEVSFENGLHIACETGYPYEFEISYRVLAGDKTLAIRIPGWSRKNGFLLNGKSVSIPDGDGSWKADGRTLTLQKGYLYVPVQTGDALSLMLDDTPYYVYPNTKVPRLSGCVAIMRGPLVYCFEGKDNENDVLSLSLVEDGKITVRPYDKTLLGGTVVLEAEAVRTVTGNELYSMEQPKYLPCTAVAVPYYTWGNRGENQMRVWMPCRGN